MRVMLVLALLGGCTRRNPVACTPGEQRPCACLGGSAGVQICSASGSGLGECLGCPGGPQLDLAPLADLMSFSPDLTGTGVDLAGVDLAGADLAGADLSIAAADDLAVPPDLSVAADLTCLTATCASPLPSNAGCGAVEVCNNGRDDNCNGTVDEGCGCVPGAVERCFPGAPGKRGVGACTDGTQTCTGAGTWGPCVGAIVPSAESCDKLDNDCNGCADEDICCSPIFDCPAAGDSRIAPVLAYTDKALLGGSFFTGDAVTWSWTVEGGPCDRLFASPQFTPATSARSFTLTNSNSENATARFALLGDYTVTLTVLDTLGTTRSCKWVQKVTAPGVRFELCWDHQGTGTQGGADLDLHVHKFDGPSPSPTAWFQAVAGVNNPRDCFWNNCAASAFMFAGGADFAYPNTTPDTTCHGTMDGATWDMLGFCHNPRLDLDNINGVAVPEITSSDNATNGDTLRAMVHYYGQDGATSSTVVNEHPIVNVYCGGTLKATYGQSPDPIPDGFNFGMSLNANGGGAGMLWRVADVHATGLDGGGNTTCTVTPLHPPLTSSGYWVVTDRNNVDFSY